MALRAPNPLMHNDLRAKCWCGLLMDHSAEHEARPECRDQGDRSSERDRGFAQFGYVTGREVIRSRPLSPPTSIRNSDLLVPGTNFTGPTPQRIGLPARKHGVTMNSSRRDFLGRAAAGRVSHP
jgi:hypothetical protein